MATGGSQLSLCGFSNEVRVVGRLQSSHVPSKEAYLSPRRALSLVATKASSVRYVVKIERDSGFM
jgi:hypothetical protein